MLQVLQETYGECEGEGKGGAESGAQMFQVWKEGMFSDFIDGYLRKRASWSAYITPARRSSVARHCPRYLREEGVGGEWCTSGRAIWKAARTGVRVGVPRTYDQFEAQNSKDAKGP